MNRGTTRLLLLLAVGLFAFIYFFERHTPNTDQIAARAAHVFPDFVPADATAVGVMQKSNVVLRVVRGPSGWRLSAPVLYPAESAMIEHCLDVIARLRQQGTVSAAEILAQSNHLAAFGVDPPEATVVLERGTRRTEFRLGSRTILGNQIYLQVVGQDGLVAVDADLLKALPSSVSEWRDRALVDLRRLEFNRLDVRPGTNGFELLRNPTNRLWQMTKPLLTRADNFGLQDLLQRLQMTQISQFVVDDPRADLEPFGLQPPERELVFGQGTNDLLVLQFGKSPTNDSTQTFVRRLDTSNVVLVARSAVAAWLAKYHAFCDRHMMIFQPDAVDRIEGRAQEAFALERATNGTWRLVEPFAAPADGLLVLEMLAELADLKFTEFENEVVADFASYGLAPPRRSYALKTSLTNSVGQVTNQTIAQIQFGYPTRDQFFARRSLENSVVKVLDYGRLPQAAYQLRERRIWNFSTNQIVAMTVQHLGQTRKVVRSGPAQWATEPGSTAAVQPFATEEFAWRLGHLRAERWVARGADQLARYGFPAVDYQITIEVRTADKSAFYTVRFGINAPSQRPYAAVQLEGQAEPVIFECSADLAEMVKSDLAAP